MDLPSNSYSFSPDFVLEVLDYVLAEQMKGHSPTTASIASHFNKSIEEIRALHRHLEESGEFD